MRNSQSHFEAALASRLRVHVERLAGLIGPRHTGRPGAMDAAAAMIERELSGAGYVVERQWYDALGVPVANLIAERHGSDERAGAEIIVLGAHYDTVESTPGADDNASAVAVLLETASLLRELAPRRTVRFAAFACEEPPHFYTQTMGSQIYARRCRARGEAVVGVLCLEMVGYYDDTPGCQQVPATIPRWLRWTLPRRGDFLAAVGNLRSWRLCWRFRRGFRSVSRFPLVSLVLPEAVRDIRLSDNSSFWDQGFAALMLTDTSFLRNPHYHLPSDTPETLDYERMAAVTIGVAGAVARLAGARWRPAP